MESSAYEAGQTVGQSVVILGLFGLLIVAAIFFIIAVIKAFTRKTRGWIIGSIVSAVIAFGALVGTVSMAMHMAVTKAKGKVQAMIGKKREVSPDGRISLEIPGNWSQQTERFEIAALFATDALETQCAMVTVDSKQDFVGSLAEYDEASTEGLVQNLTGEVTKSSPESGKVGEFPAIRRRLEGTMDNIRLVYQIASVETPGHYYRILTWTSPSRETKAAPVFEEIIGSFRLEAPETAVAAAAPVDPGDFAGRVNAIVIDLLAADPSKLGPDTRLAEDLGADSLDSVELVMAVEEEFELSISDEDAAKMRTLGDIVRFVEARAAEQRVEEE